MWQMPTLRTVHVFAAGSIKPLHLSDKSFSRLGTCQNWRFIGEMAQGIKLFMEKDKYPDEKRWSERAERTVISAPVSLTKQQVIHRSASPHLSGISFKTSSEKKWTLLNYILYSSKRRKQTVNIFRKLKNGVLLFFIVTIPHKQEKDSLKIAVLHQECASKTLSLLLSC